MNENKKRINILIILGTLFLIYAYLGNYLVLPGYLRYLERGRTSVSGANLIYLSFLEL